MNLILFAPCCFGGLLYGNDLVLLLLTVLATRRAGMGVVSRSYLCCRIGEQGKLTGIKRSPISMTN